MLLLMSTIVALRVPSIRELISTRLRAEAEAEVQLGVTICAVADEAAAEGALPLLEGVHFAKCSLREEATDRAPLAGIDELALVLGARLLLPSGRRQVGREGRCVDPH